MTQQNQDIFFASNESTNHSWKRVLPIRGPEIRVSQRCVL